MDNRIRTLGLAVYRRGFRLVAGSPWRVIRRACNGAQQPRVLGFRDLAEVALEGLCYVAWFLYTPIPRPRQWTAGPGFVGRLPKRGVHPPALTGSCPDGLGTTPQVQHALWLGRGGELLQLVWNEPGRRGLPFRETYDTRPARFFVFPLAAWTAFSALYYVMPWLGVRVSESAMSARGIETLTLLLLGPILALGMLVAHYCVPCLQMPRYRELRRFKERLWASRVRYSGGDGSCPEQAIVVRGALHPLVAKAGELWLLMVACEVRGLDWEIVRFEHLALGWRQIDEWVIRLAHSREKTIYFDVTESFASC